MLATYIRHTFMRQDVIDNLSRMLIIGTNNALEAESTQEEMLKFALRIVNNQQIKDGVLENIVYSPVRSYFSFG